jgi:hypothetical protein
MKKILPIIGFAFVSDQAFSSLSLTHSAIDKYKNKESATLVYIDKENGDNTYQIDMALHGFCNACEKSFFEDQIGRNLKLRYGPLVEVHRNSDMDPKKETNNIQAGGTIALFVGDEEEIGLSLWDLMLDTAYKHDEIKDKKSIIYNFTATMANLPVPFSSCNFGEFCLSSGGNTRWYIDPYVGWYGADLRSGGTGHINYVYSKINIGVQPLYKLDPVGKDIEFVFKYSNWNTSSNTGDFKASDETPELKEASIIYWISPPNDNISDKDKHSSSNFHFGISLDYFDGANPQQDKPLQTYSQITLKLGFSI